MKQIRWGRAALAAILAEILGVAALALLVAVFGPDGSEAAMAYANRLGQLVGPASGFILCLLGGWWTAKQAAPGHHLRNGLAMGGLAAVLDVTIALALTGTLAPLLIGSNLGRLAGGTIGGWLAGRQAGNAA